jgi:hypothetical protein
MIKTMKLKRTKKTKKIKKTKKTQKTHKMNKKTKKNNLKGGGDRSLATRNKIKAAPGAALRGIKSASGAVVNKIKAAPGAALRKIKAAPGAALNAITPGARASAVVGAVADTGRSAIKGILTMENPIVYAYQLIERNVFGWDTIEQDRKMGKTAKSIVGDSLKEKNKGFTAMQLLKGKDFLPGGKNFVPPPTPPKL